MASATYRRLRYCRSSSLRQAVRLRHERTEHLSGQDLADPASLLLLLKMAAVGGQAVQSGTAEALDDDWEESDAKCPVHQYVYVL